MKISVHHDPGMQHQTCAKVLEAQSDFAVEDGTYQFGGALVEVAVAKKATDKFIAEIAKTNGTTFFNAGLQLVNSSFGTL